MRSGFSFISQEAKMTEIKTFQRIIQFLILQNGELIGNVNEERIAYEKMAEAYHINKKPKHFKIIQLTTDVFENRKAQKHTCIFEALVFRSEV